MPNPMFSWHLNRKDATTAPVADLADLAGLWDRDAGVYQMCVVQCLNLTGSMLQFTILVGPQPSLQAPGTLNATPYTVDLNDGRSVWGELPSTAQLYVNGSSDDVCYLGLNEDWLIEHVGDAGGLKDGGGGGLPKYPKLASL